MDFELGNPQRQAGVWDNVKSLLIILLFASLVVSARANVQLASPFTSHMVLQCDRKVPVWGAAAAGEQVTVEFAGQKISTPADADGGGASTSSR